MLQLKFSTHEGILPVWVLTYLSINAVYLSKKIGAIANTYLNTDRVLPNYVSNFAESINCDRSQIQSCQVC
ncbi:MULTISPECIES: hypothetical protein [Nostoc]|uniref:Uncharacterized protein n=1 Tax=Nostoc paludosum FACHB-159 TaxID=2692908 RepID=A0ABR8K1V8_9NOSO|nr:MULTISPECIES: hypothetical protein [Nostoc]MBD2678283.1 hypothetical protein [Nostoc sp. FACHB-857]MBD2733401.1 hypothetical protein [Nostoc paludosum FACHB-159]